MSERKKNGAKTPYTPNMESPGRKKRSYRGPLGAILTLLLPPVGMAYLWRAGVFRTRGRVVLTALGTIVLSLWCVWFLPSQELYSEPPVPAVPGMVTVAPDDGTASALSNLDQLLAQRQAERDAAAGITPEPTSTNDPEYLAQQQAILQTVVYSVYGNSANFYHKNPVCNTQSNRRELTIEEAMYDGMGACPECNPPVYQGP